MKADRITAQSDVAALRAETCYDLARQSGIVGVIRNAPRDLSTNPEHFEGFGHPKAARSG